MTIDTLMRAVLDVRRGTEPKLFAGSRIAFDAWLDREHKGTWVQVSPMVDRPTTVAGVPIEISRVLPRWAFAIVQLGGEGTLHDLEYGGSAPVRNLSDLRAAIAGMEAQREMWQRAGNAPALARLEEPGPDAQAPTLGGL